MPQAPAAAEIIVQPAEVVEPEELPQGEPTPGGFGSAHFEDEGMRKWDADASTEAQRVLIENQKAEQERLKADIERYRQARKEADAAFDADRDRLKVLLDRRQ